MKKFYVGFDISKNWLDMAICDQEGSFSHDVTRHENSVNGIEKAIKAIKKTHGNTTVCFENTGNYGLLLAHLLEENDLGYSMVSPVEIKRSIGMTRGKSDTIDAKRIAMYGMTNYRKLKPSKLNSKPLLELKHLLSYRNQLVSISKKLKCSQKSFVISLKTVNVSSIIESLENKLKELKNDIKKVESDIESLIESEKELSKNYHLAMSVRGIGPVISAYMLVYTNNYKAFDCPRKFNCYAGLAPFENTSGSSIKGRTATSFFRNKKIKALLFSSANCAAIYDKQLKAYYKRKTTEGKHRMVVLNAVAAKIVYRIFAVVKRQSPYIEFAQ